MSLAPLFLLTAVALAPPPADGPDFNREVRPILSEHCFKCHGLATHRGDLRLDVRDEAIAAEAIVPGKPDKSGLVERIKAHDADRMPPPETGKGLTAKQIDTLTRWVAGGAKYDRHWAFAPPTRSAPPGDAKNPIDAFVRQKLSETGLKPSPEADKTTLIRRVSLDLTGLLPSPAEVAAFAADRSPDAYGKLVDRLLASPHYGERQARRWLDVARYADSNGYTVDGNRSIWPWRDWVVNALNADMPFDRFTVEQLAGDLLPKPTVAQLVATGFHRNTAYNEEGGADPEQFRDERTLDRASTTATVWLGVTMGCAQCHDHKFDPVTQADYYRLYAFFNSVDEPSIPVAEDPKLAAEIKRLESERKALPKGKEPKTLDARIKKLKQQIPTTLVMRERKEPRETFVHVRGDFLRHGDRVEPGFPAAFTAPGTPKPKNRLDLARWLVSDANPLTARVTVNREWQHFFGLGLVETENDFGMQGRLPTHPDLLDWLAVEFRKPSDPAAPPWSFKHLHKLIVTSATYKQSSIARADIAERDPRNTLLARQNRLRLDAETLRDAGLCASGLLNPKLGGPGVYPPLPPDFFSFTQARKNWPEDKGPDRYRRGLYTFIYRQSQHHLLTTFDGADAQVSCTRRNRSDTPLQALHLANDPVFIEFAAGLGKRVESDGPADLPGRVDYAFQLCTSRMPTDAEREALTAYFQTLNGRDPETAWAKLARVLLNLDEFLTRE
jgi:hypothetical protein